VHWFPNSLLVHAHCLSVKSLYLWSLVHLLSCYPSFFEDLFIWSHLLVYFDLREEQGNSIEQGCTTRKPGECGP